MGVEIEGFAVHVDTGRWSDDVLRGVDLAIGAGSLTVLMGGSGSGKSMLARAVAGALPASAEVVRGGVRVDGARVQSPGRPNAAAVAGYVPQAGVDAFDAASPVRDAFRRSADRSGLVVEDACAAVGYPAHCAPQLPAQHSGGEIQRAALADAMLSGAATLMVDEPTASLDAFHAQRVWHTLRDQADAGVTVMVISHDLPIIEPLGVADRYVVMEEGRVLADGAPHEVRRSTVPSVAAIFRPFGT
ncbi:ATP-binding cassette domain-containing protein [Tsukamurella sp. 1534]|uniref:ATP-binding cassette domain-containing protein n=1 Tax=Tsukamurella sp. 1534 TaxID=1151061 RepID=UPI00030DEA5A|nr:ATP-binding cassette domain-containing protein [Tsukamurella sp. 1534]